MNYQIVGCSLQNHQGFVIYNNGGFMIDCWLLISTDTLDKWEDRFVCEHVRYFKVLEGNQGKLSVGPSYT